jgi:hypothetical protein
MLRCAFAALMALHAIGNYFHRISIAVLRRIPGLGLLPIARAAVYAGH